jgi:phage baseplate assembly protein W
MKHKKTFLGVGWKFPPSFDRKTGSIMLVSEEEDIKESLYILLSTKPGERVMMPDYGCDLNKMVFQAIDASLITQMEDIIQRAILYFEPRILVEKIDISADNETEGLLNIDIHYKVSKTNKRSNMVYPYYIIEGNDARYRPINPY